MNDIETTTEPVNPLTGGLTAITVHSRDSVTGTTDVQGLVVAPGLAITPSPKRDERRPDRYSLTHIPTGLSAIPALCGVHIQDAVASAVAAGIDWAITGKADIIDAVKATTFPATMTAARRTCNSAWCVGDGPQPPSWNVQCLTCGWEWNDEGVDGPLSVADAKNAAREHDCTPEVVIMSPDTKKWHDPWLVNDDGTIRDLSGKGAERAPDTSGEVQ